MVRNISFKRCCKSNIKFKNVLKNGEQKQNFHPHTFLTKLLVGIIDICARKYSAVIDSSKVQDKLCLIEYSLFTDFI
jgi:hypothetical protein